MSETRNGFREQLLATEPVNQNLRDKYQQEMEKMFTDEMKGVRKVGWWANHIVLLLFGCFLIAGALFEGPFELNRTGRWLWAIPGFFTILVSLIGMRMGAKKKIDLRKDSKFMAKFGSVGLDIVAYSILIIAFMSGNLQTMSILAPIAILIIIMGMLIRIYDKVQQGELNTRENFLEIKYTLAQLEERLGGSK